MPALSPAVTIYSTSWCTFCRAEKQFLDQQGIAYRDLNIEDDAVAADRLRQLSDQIGTPFTVITRPDGTEVGILGFDRPRLVQELRLTL